MSFYYWQPVFAPDSTETEILKDNDVRDLYVRYFDVDWPDSDSIAEPISPIRFDNFPSGYAIIPVIHIHGRVFEKLDSAALPAFSTRLLTMIGRMNASAHLQTEEIQFDYDWTEKTRQNYFRFLRQMKSLSGSVISSTIRLQQLKLSGNTGIPPIDYGVLIFYNTDTAPGNPVFERPIAHRYTPALRSYPLTLDVALPIFRSVSADDLLEMVGEVNQHSNHRIHDLIFFDLSRQNISRYDKGVFKEVLDHSE